MPGPATAIQEAAPRGAAGPILVLFFASGATSLAAEVVLERLLTYVFGASHLATATVLAAYMAGLSIGAALLGALTRRLRRPLRVYASLELGVGLFLTLTPGLFELARAAGLSASRAWIDRPVLLTAARFAGSFGFILVPTLLMGGTLPVLVSAFGSQPGRQRLASLYGANTLGAALGTLVSAYVSIPRLGLDGTLFAAALIDVAIALAAFAICSRRTLSPGTTPTAAEAPPPGPWLPSAEVAGLAFLQGLLTFALEVTWAHLIRTVIGVTVYAFALMLAAMLLGIGGGSLLAARLQRRGARPLLVFCASEAALGGSVVATLFLWDRFPAVIDLCLAWRSHWSFAAREAVRFAFTLAGVLPAAVAAGAALPALVSSARRERGGAGAWVGLVVSANTAGAIAGSLVAGFVLLGRVSSARILLCCALAAAAAAAAAAARGRPRGPATRALRWAIAWTAAVAAVGLSFPGWDPQRLTAGTHYYWQRAPARTGGIVFFAEDAQTGFVTVERDAAGGRVVKTNGKYEGSSEPGEFQDHVATLGALYVRRFERAALVGLGPGRTLALLHQMSFGHVDVVEYSRAMVRAARAEFPEFVGEPLGDPRVRLVVDDGRGYLQASPERYDYVAVAITGAAFAGVGSFYTREFFAAVRQRLSPGGVFLIWLQLHHVGEREVRSVVRTLVSEFRDVHVFATPDGRQGYLVASMDPLQIDPRSAERLSAVPLLRTALERAGMASALELVALNVFSTREESVAFGRTPDGSGRLPVLYTDLFPLFEYVTPYALAQSGSEVNLRAFSLAGLPQFRPQIPEGQRAGLLGLRLLVQGDNPAALVALQRSRDLLGTSRWDALISQLRSPAGRR